MNLELCSVRSENSVIPHFFVILLSISYKKKAVFDKHGCSNATCSDNALNWSIPHRPQMP